MRRALVLMTVLAMGVLLALSPAAAASDHRMRVNEIELSEAGSTAAQFIELVDVAVGEPFPFPPYGIVAYNSAGVQQGVEQTFPAGTFAPPRDNTRPFLVATDSASSAGIRDAELSLSLPTGSGQLCFFRGGDPDIANNRIHCLSYGSISSPVPTDPTGGGNEIGPTPPDGRSLQRCPAGPVVGNRTPKAANACAGAGGGGAGGGGGGSSASDTRKPKLKLGGKKTQDVDKLAVTVTLDEDGTVSATGTVRVPNSSKLYRFKKARKSVKAGKRVRLRLRLSRRAKRAVKRALAAGRRLRAKVKVTAADKAKNKTTKRKTIRLTN
jgi:hypothetical protein